MEATSAIPVDITKSGFLDNLDRANQAIKDISAVPIGHRSSPQERVVVSNSELQRRALINLSKAMESIGKEVHQLRVEEQLVAKQEQGLELRVDSLTQQVVKPLVNRVDKLETKIDASLALAA
ncbi:MAG: hypothetical protein LW817_01120 [Candidatus Caenarcaniphilales bacterium]|jgi:hypothetical protein|nr:hypothetical protein [Candidatus Caenarcaniphilales bacterium]